MARFLCLCMGMESSVIAIDDNKVTTFFDRAPALLFVYGGGREERVDVSFLLPIEKSELVELQDAHVVVCDGVSSMCREQLTSRGIRVVCVARQQAKWTAGSRPTRRTELPLPQPSSGAAVLEGCGRGMVVVAMQDGACAIPAQTRTTRRN
jgi:predicted Fe-Mo cluster-binding NifX family protein